MVQYNPFSQDVMLDPHPIFAKLREEADEGKWAAIVIEETGVKNVVANPSSGGFLDELPDFMWHNELPMASASQYAQWCVFRSAKDR